MQCITVWLRALLFYELIIAAMLHCGQNPAIDAKIQWSPCKQTQPVFIPIETTNASTKRRQRTNAVNIINFCNLLSPMMYNHLAAEGHSVVGNYKWTAARWWGPTVNIRPTLPQAVITMLRNYIWKTAHYEHNEPNYYSACEQRMSCDHSRY